MSPKVEKWGRTPTILSAAALLVAMAALAIAVSGIATASPKVIVRKGDIAPGAVTAKALAKGAVTAPKIQKGTITAAKLGAGSVTGEKLANGSVTSGKLGAASVSSQAIAGNAVTSSAIAPLSVGAAQLAELEVVIKTMADQDKVEHNGEWTPSNPETASCAPGAKLTGSGFAVTAPSPPNGLVQWIEALPVINGETRGVTGRFTSDAGGTASGEIVAVCLKPTP